MSGGGGGGGPGGGFEPTAKTPCAELRFRAVVDSPQPAALTLSSGDLLRVTLEEAPRPVIHLIDQAGNLIGSIVTRAADLLRCIQDGFEYEAEVLDIDGGRIEVEVRPT